MEAELEEIQRDFARMPPLVLRARLVEAGYPRHLYKYRRVPPASEREGRRNFEALILDNQLWLATPASFNDPFDGQADYEIPIRGYDLRQTLVRRVRQLMGLTSKQANEFVTSDMVARPERLVAMLRANHNRLLSDLGVCAMSTEPANPLMWAHYTGEHRGVCLQFRVAHDLSALMAHPVEYSDTYPVIRNAFDSGDRRDDLATLLRKSTEWEYEQEWRILKPGLPNVALKVAPQALTAVILGLRCTDERAYVLGMIDERERRYGIRPKIYDAFPAPREYRVRFRRVW
jgi:hypothetical protein